MWLIGVLINLLSPFLITLVCTALWGRAGAFASFVAVTALSYAINLPYLFYASPENLKPATGFFFGASSLQAIVWLIIWIPAALIGLSIRARRPPARLSN
jgi:hypothetical protein